MIVALTLLLLGSAGAFAQASEPPTPPLTIESCEAYLEHPEWWSPNAARSAVELFRWIALLHSDQLAAMETTESIDEFLNLMFIAAGHSIAPSPQGIFLGWADTITGGLYVSRMYGRRDETRKALWQDASKAMRDSDDHSTRFAFIILKNLERVQKSMTPNTPVVLTLFGPINDITVTYDFTEVGDRAFLAKFKELLAPVNDPAVFALTFALLRAEVGRVITRHRTLAKQIDKNTRLEVMKTALKHVRAPLLEDAIHLFAARHGALTPELAVARPTVLPAPPAHNEVEAAPRPPSEVERSTEIRAYLEHPDRLANRGVEEPDVIKWAEVERELWEVSLYLSQIQRYAALLNVSKPDWSQLRAPTTLSLAAHQNLTESVRRAADVRKLVLDAQDLTALITDFIGREANALAEFNRIEARVNALPPGARGAWQTSMRLLQNLRGVADLNATALAHRAHALGDCLETLRKLQNDLPHFTSEPTTP